MLPEVVWNMPPMGTFNLHGSLLPQYRGAAPINWAIINGEKETGVTTFFLQHEIDTGDLILQKKIAIHRTDNAETIHDQLMVLGAQTVVETVDCILDGTAPKMPQPEVAELKMAPKIFKETCKINWDNDCESIYNFVRGLSPYPTAWSELMNDNTPSIPMKIYEVTTEQTSHTHTPGTIVTDGKKELKVVCKDGFVSIQSLQLAGKKRMNSDEFLRGYKIDLLKQLA